MYVMYLQILEHLGHYKTVLELVILPEAHSHKICNWKDWENALHFKIKILWTKDFIVEWREIHLVVEQHNIFFIWLKFMQLKFLYLTH